MIGSGVPGSLRYRREGAEVAGGCGCGCALSRRGFLATLAGGAAVAATGAIAAAPAAKRGIIDVHAHYITPELKAAGAAGPMVGWSLDKHLEEMDRAGVARSLLSITTPGVTATGERGRALVRSSNEWAARAVADHPDQLGFFTYVQPADADATLKEMEYGFDTLKANGVGLFTSYDDKYLGDPVFDPLFAELNRRGAVVYVHPTSGPCCRGVVPTVADTVIEYGTDTSRAIASYVYRGAARRYPNVKMIWSHSGGTMPFVIERFDFQDRGGQFKKTAPDGFRAEIAKFYFDVAQAANPVATGALRQVVPVEQIVFGTDYPFRTMAEHVTSLETGKVFTRAELAGLYRGNVARGLPALLAAPRRA